MRPVVDKSAEHSAYAENSFYFLPDVALVTGTQFLHAVRDRRDRFLVQRRPSGRRTFES